MSDSFSEVTSQSWFGRIGGAFKGIVVGLILIGVAFVLLFWNEGRAVKRHKTLQEGGGAVVSVPASEVDPGNEGRLVHLSGLAETGETLTDAEFGIARRALKLRRRVEMYQWKESSQSETKKKLGGGTETVTTYSYDRTWDDSLISSSGFKKPAGHENPGSMPVSSRELRAGKVTVGAFTLSPSLVGKISRYQPVPVPSGEPPSSPAGRLQAYGEGYYLGNSPSSPQIGDMRITFESVDPLEVSLLSRQAGETFEPYLASTGGKIELLEIGSLTAEEMIQEAVESNKLMTWILRFVGCLLMFFGIAAVLRPLSVLADVVPLFGNIVGAGTSIVALLIAALLSLITIGVAWIVYRPLVGAAVLAAAAAVVFLIVTRMKKGKAAATAAQPPPPPLAAGG
jgi:hypothetical protein